MKRVKRVAAMLLTLILLVTTFASIVPTASAAISTSTFNTKVQAFLSDSRWKNGIAWGDSQTPKLSKWSSTGCCAYAADFAAYVYGSTSAAWTGSDFTKFTDLNEIRAGDIIHTSNHWFVVISRTGNTFYTAEGNFDDKVRVSTDGWGIKNGKIYNLKATDGERTFVYGYHYKFSDSSTASTGSSSQVYYNIDLSAQVLKSRINQQVSGDCAVVSMATVEAYMYSATSTADKNTVYKALVSKNGDNDYAYWSNCGYVSYSSINWDTVYDQLSKGYPVIVHRPATSTKVQHWAVVAGYKGSTTTLQKDKFVIVDVYHGTGGTDIYTSASWASGTSIDRMVTRKNGISLTSLSGIRMAINHPAPVHPYGEGHGVYGYITSNVNLTSVQLMVTNLSTGSNVYNKTVTPNAKSYLLYNLDSEVTFAKWPEGEYFYTVIAKTASGTRSYQKYFTIDATWPSSSPTRPITFEFDANGGTGTVAAQTVNHGGTLTIPATVPTRTGYTFKGWNVKRVNDSTWFCGSKGWYTDAQIKTYGYTPVVYSSANSYGIDYSWMQSCFTNQVFVFYAIWEQNTPSTYTVSYDANGGTGTPASQTKTAGTALTLSNTVPVRSGYTFLGWSPSQSAATAAYQPGSSFNTDADTTLYAVWQKQPSTEPQVLVSGGTVTPGGTVTVDISVDNNPGIAYLTLTPSYDTSVLTLTSVENGTVIKDFDQGTNLTWSADENTDENGTMARLTFKVSEDAPEGSYKVTVLVREAYNLLGEDVSFAVADGSITVSSMVYGDANGDGAVNGKDVLLLRRYMANYDYDTGSSTVTAYPGADANGDGVVNGKDVLLLRRYMANYDYDTGASSVVLGPA